MGEETHGGRWMRALGRWLRWAEELIISVGLAAATLLLFANVVARYAFDTGLTWALEAVEYLFAWVVLVGAAYGLAQGAHLGIDLLQERLAPAWRRRLALLGVALSLGFAGPLFWLSLSYVRQIRAWGDLTLDLQIPQWIPYLALPVGTGLMVVHLLALGYRVWTGQAARLHAREGEKGQTRGGVD